MSGPAGEPAATVATPEGPAGSAPAAPPESNIELISHVNSWSSFVLVVATSTLFPFALTFIGRTVESLLKTTPWGSRSLILRALQSLFPVSNHSLDEEFMPLSKLLTSAARLIADLLNDDRDASVAPATPAEAPERERRGSLLTHKARSILRRTTSMFLEDDWSSAGEGSGSANSQHNGGRNHHSRSTQEIVLRSVDTVVAWTGSALMFLELPPILREPIRVTCYCCLAVRFVVPLAGSSRSLALEAFSLGDVSRDDTVRMAVDAMGGLFEILIYVAGVSFLAYALGFQGSLSSAVTGLGIGGIALAFSLQRTLEALAGTVSLVMDKPFIVGDRVTLATGEMGTVERIGMRTTSIRLVQDGELLIVPNAELASTKLKNRSRCDFRRIELRFELDPQQVASLSGGGGVSLIRLALERAARQAPNVARVERAVLAGFGVFGGLVFEVVFFIVGNETQQVRAARHRVLELSLYALRDMGLGVMRHVHASSSSRESGLPRGKGVAEEEEEENGIFDQSAGLASEQPLATTPTTVKLEGLLEEIVEFHSASGGHQGEQVSESE